MTDIVKRLRDWQIRSFRSNHDDALEAADEIERLRKENELLRLGWCKESEKRMKDWQDEPIATKEWRNEIRATPNIITTGDTQCRHCNGAGQIQVKYQNNGDFLSLDNV